jgi:hypothetical protein
VTRRQPQSPALRDRHRFLQLPRLVREVDGGGHGAGHLPGDGGRLHCAGASPAWAASGTRTSSFAYDTATGLLTQEVVEPGRPSLWLETDTVYDAFGNKTSVTVSGIDIVTRSSITTYDTKGEFATTNTNTLSQSETWQYDPRFDNPTSHVGPNVPPPRPGATTSTAARPRRCARTQIAAIRSPT